jgi:hypothetical protein
MMKYNVVNVMHINHRIIYHCATLLFKHTNMNEFETLQINSSIKCLSE